jgi:hypothetical protein
MEANQRHYLNFDVLKAIMVKWLNLQHTYKQTSRQEFSYNLFKKIEE